MAAEEYVLRWNNHQQNFASVVEDLWRQDTFTDVILCSEGRVFPAHRVILSACSPYFLEMLSKVPEHQHPVVFLQGVPLKDLHALLTFMYSGEVVVSNGDLASFFRTAENLQVKGLASSSRPFNIESALRFPAAEKQAAPGIDLADQRPPVLEPLPPEPAGVESPKPRAPVPTSPQQTPPPRPLQLGSLSMDPSTQHHSMLLSSLMGARYSPPQQTSRPLPPSLLSGLTSPGRRSLIPSPQIGPEVPWLPPRTPVPPAPRLALYPPPGPSYSRRGRPPSDANAANPAAGEGRETAPPVSQAQVLRVTVVTPQGPVTMFECPFCRKRFRRRDHLRQHIRTHTGEKPFECRICGRRFSQSQQVRIHMRVHSDQPMTSQGRGRGRGGLGLAGLPPSSGSSLGETLVTESDVHGRISSRSSLSAESQSPRTSTASSPPPRPGSPPPAADSKDAVTPKEESM